MTRITFQLHDGTQRTVDVDPDTTLMRAAVDNDVPGINGECNGCATCATCKVQVAESWFDRLPGIDEIEESLLDDAAPRTRLSCQIAITPDLDGLTVAVPISQYA
ncbi:2Fe-2S iron-sulfur cluster-binding protein [Novosphingobium lentum]|uniref:2Fe-2S iron-sulfur cluster-binding protein n=1 Tax=Novosphingobium lentum TaxID=145287 RepID=UPI00082CC167|nr:2Fe-2S iron-sulfur cluster-binding protein [Novosphingobium lentum]